jgi:SAM-dependent methyltransferase
MGVRRTLVLLGAATAGFALLRHRAGALGRSVPGGILIGDVSAYDRMSRILLAPFFESIAADVAKAAAAGARVLEVGCGPGHLSVRMARDHGLEVTALDLDPAMIERARAYADRSGGVRPSFVVGDAAALPFPDASFDLVVSTMSMHHWADATVGLNEIGRVLRPNGRALVWDLRPGALPFHGGVPDPVERAQGANLRVLRAEPWRWPWRFAFSQRIELVPPGGGPDTGRAGGSAG